MGKNNNEVWLIHSLFREFYKKILMLVFTHEETATLFTPEKKRSLIQIPKSSYLQFLALQY